MIQRIQTVYLLIALIFSILLFVVPMWSTTLQSDGMSEIGAGTHLLLMPVAALLCLTLLISIFLFGKRKLQIIICRVAMTFTILFFLMSLLFIHKEQNLFSSGTLKGFSFGAIFPIIIFVFELLAVSNIQKDEKMIRDMDRLR